MWSHPEVILKSSWGYPEICLKIWARNKKNEYFRTICAAQTDRQSDNPWDFLHWILSYHFIKKQNCLTRCRCKDVKWIQLHWYDKHIWWHDINADTVWPCWCHNIMIAWMSLLGPVYHQSCWNSPGRHREAVQWLVTRDMQAQPSQSRQHDHWPLNGAQENFTRYLTLTSLTLARKGCSGQFFLPSFLNVKCQRN